MKQIRKRLTYANVMSSIAVFLVLGGATAIAAKKIGANELKANSVKTGKIVKEAVTTSKIKNESVSTSKLAKEAVATDKLAKESVTTDKLAKEAVTTAKIADGAVTGAKVNEASLNGVVQNVTYVGDATGGGSEDKRNLTVDCGPGRRAIGAFYETFGLSGDPKIAVTIVRRATIAGETNRGIQVFAEEITTTADQWQMTATATCATL